MPESKQLTGLKKRQQIASANKMIFVWVIVASVVVSLCAVTVQFLVRQAIVNQNVIGAKLQTQGILAKNIENVEKLKQNVDALQANHSLAIVKANPSDTNLKVVLDALPTTNDATALGASLQQVILPRSGVNVSDIATVAQGTSATAPSSTETVPTSDTPTAQFSFVATGDYIRIKAMLSDLEHTIRPINIQKLSLQGVDGKVKAVVDGVSYYAPSQTVQTGMRTL